MMRHPNARALSSAAAAQHGNMGLWGRSRTGSTIMVAVLLMVAALLSASAWLPAIASPATPDAEGGGRSDGAAPSTELSLGTISVYVTPSSSSGAIGDLFTVYVRANAGSNTVDAADVYLNYNATYLQVQSVTPGTALETTITYGDTGSSVHYVAGRLASPGYVTGDFLMFTVVFRGKAAGAANLSFGSTTFAREGVAHSTSPSGGSITVLAATNTPTPTNTGVYTPVPNPTATPTPDPDLDLIELRQGVDGYEGFTDTYLDAWAPTVNYCSDQHLFVRSPHVQSALIRADVSQLTPGTTVGRAVLTLYQRSSADKVIEGDLWNVIRGWECDEANWTEASDGVLWDGVGAHQPGSDHDAMEAFTRPLFPVYANYRNYPFDFEVTALVQNWIDDPESNQGMVITVDSATSGWVKFASSEYFDQSVRPILRIWFESGPTPTPTGTATGTPTETPVGARVEGPVFVDDNGNGLDDDGEELVSGAEVSLTGMSDPGFSRTTTSDGEGWYNFSGVPGGMYKLQVTGVPLGYKATSSPIQLGVSADAVMRMPLPLSKTGSSLYLPLVFKSE